MNQKSIQQQKSKYRDAMRRRRCALSNTQLQQAALGLCQQYKQQQTLFNSAQKQGLKVALYLQHDHELGTSELISYLRIQGCEIYLPKIAAIAQVQSLDDASKISRTLENQQTATQNKPSNTLQFSRFDKDCQMSKNRFGIFEPTEDNFIDAETLNILFLPLTAFDKSGKRIGMGGGYYDRLLAQMNTQNLHLIGLAYDFQEIDYCPSGSHDQSIDYVLTPSKLLTMRQT